MNLQFDQDEAAMSAREERERSRVTEAGPPRREEGWASQGGGKHTARAAGEGAVGRYLTGAAEACVHWQERSVRTHSRMMLAGPRTVE